MSSPALVFEHQDDRPAPHGARTAAHPALGTKCSTLRRAPLCGLSRSFRLPLEERAGIRSGLKTDQAGCLYVFYVHTGYRYKCIAPIMKEYITYDIHQQQHSAVSRALHTQRDGDT